MRSRIFPAVTALSLALAMTGCGDTSKVDKIIDSSSQSVEDQLVDELAKQAEEQAGTGLAPNTTAPAPLPDISEIDASNGEFDIDLTTLDANMTYAQVYDMMLNPDNYKDKYIKASGTFAHTEENGRDYFAVLIADAAACCSQGLEFQLKDADSLSFPDDYPNVGDELVITGNFNSYKEGNYTYIELLDATMEKA